MSESFSELRKMHNWRDSDWVLCNAQEVSWHLAKVLRAFGQFKSSICEYDGVYNAVTAVSFRLSELLMSR